MAGPMNEIKIAIKGDQIKFIYSDDLLGLLDQGDHQITRASHVEPTPEGWVADMAPSGGSKLGPYRTRKEALEAEVAWLNERM